MTNSWTESSFTFNNELFLTVVSFLSLEKAQSGQALRVGSLRLELNVAKGKLSMFCKDCIFLNKIVKQMHDKNI